MMHYNQNELYHHGILGMKWGKQNGPPYPLKPSDHSASEKKAGWQNSLDIIATNTQEIRNNKDGSKTIPKGFKFNRVGGAELDFNKAGGLYVSHDKLSASLYINQLGPNLITKLTKRAGTHVQNISAKENIRMASEDETLRLVLEAVNMDRDFYDTIKNSWLYTYAYDSDNGITDEAFERALKNPSSKEAKKLAYVFISTFGNSEVADSVSKVYDLFRKKGYDAIPDVYDIWTGTSTSAMILINPNKIKMTESHEITKDVMKSGRKYIKDYMKDHKGELKVNEIIK